MRRPPLVLLLVLAAALPAPVAAERLARCRRSCGAAVDACIAASPLRYRRARTVCRKRLYRTCRKLGVSACSVTPPTTQPPATLPPATLPPTTLPPATLPPTTTTTTTLPPVRSYAGTWYFSGTLASDSCGSSTYFVDSFVVSQSGTLLGGSIGSIPGSSMTGRVTSDGFELSGSFTSSGCLVVVGLVALNDGTVVLTAATGFDVSCGGATCRSIWTGTLSR